MLAGAGAPVLVAKQEGRAMKTEQDCLMSNSCCVLFLTAFLGGPKGKRFQTWGLVSEGFRLEHA